MPRLDWKQTAVLVAVIAGAVVTALFAPADFRAPLVALLTALAGFLRSPSGER